MRDHLRRPGAGARSHHLLSWPPARTVVELNAPREVYDRLIVPLIAIDMPQQELEAMPDSGYVRLTIGKGRFGLEWLKQIDLP